MGRCSTGGSSRRLRRFVRELEELALLLLWLRALEEHAILVWPIFLHSERDGGHATLTERRRHLTVGKSGTRLVPWLSVDKLPEARLAIGLWRGIALLLQRTLLANSLHCLEATLIIPVRWHRGVAGVHHWLALIATAKRWIARWLALLVWLDHLGLPLAKAALHDWGLAKIDLALCLRKGAVPRLIGGRIVAVSAEPPQTARLGKAHRV